MIACTLTWERGHPVRNYSGEEHAPRAQPCPLFHACRHCLRAKLLRKRVSPGVFQLGYTSVNRVFAIGPQAKPLAFDVTDFCKRTILPRRYLFDRVLRSCVKADDDARRGFAEKKTRDRER